MSPSGATTSPTYAGPPSDAGKSFTIPAPSRHAVSISLGVSAPGIAGTPAARQRSSTSGTTTGLTHASAPAAAASSTSAAVRTVPASTTSSGSERKRAIVSKAPSESSVISTTLIPPARNSATTRCASATRRSTATTRSRRIASITLIGARLYALAVRTLDGKTALVTGAAGAIGGAVTRAFAEAGAHVLAVDRVEAKVGDPYVADVTEPDAVEGAVDAAVERHGRLDIVFNGAGISGRALGDGPVETCTLDAWDAVLETNLKSVFLCCKHAIPALRRSGGGAIINLGSVLGLVGAEDFQTHAYAASKGGIVALTRAVAVAYAGDRIRCNAICPGLIDTPMSERARSDPRLRERLPELQPLTGAPGAPEDVAEAALYLASAEFVTGAVLTVDGGWTAR